MRHRIRPYQEDLIEIVDRSVGVFTYLCDGARVLSLVCNPHSPCVFISIDCGFSYYYGQNELTPHRKHLPQDSYYLLPTAALGY
jgi:hypothetical protein